jgi:Beta-ketoacyl synthase, N-terminal domain
LGPGLTDWDAAAAVLSGRASYAAARTVLQTPMILPAAERRRTGRVVKLAIAVALEATSRSGTNPAELASVFSSSGGDGQNCHDLCQALSQETREISPTKFANSVHNAAAGYWSIATGAKRESNVLCAFDASFCAGLLEALTQVAVDGDSVLLVAYDTEYPEPIHAKRPVPDAFGTAMVLTPRRTSVSLARIEATLGDLPEDAMADPRLESLRLKIPAARCLPLLRRLATRERGATVLGYLGQSRTVVAVEPCG